MRFLKSITMAVSCLLAGCHSVSDYENETPTFDLKSYFSGPIEAWGIVQDFRGRVTRRFKIDMCGVWQGDEGTLEEIFFFYDQVEEKRTWKISAREPHRYEGRAHDIIGHAVGQQAGNAMRWHYKMDLAVGEKTYRIKFDDWMFMMEDGVLINRSYLKKFGITVGELTIFMKKKAEGQHAQN